jgi:ankyrin repeat protein
MESNVYDAIISRNNEELKQLINTDLAILRKRHGSHHEPFITALKYRNYGAMELIISIDANWADKIYNFGHTQNLGFNYYGPLYVSILKCSYSLTKFLVERGAYFIDNWHNYCYTLMNNAAPLEKKIRLFKYLLSTIWKADKRFTHGSTLLAMLCSYDTCCTPLVLYLLKYLRNTLSDDEFHKYIDEQDERGNTAMINILYNCMNNHDKKIVFHILLRYGVDVSAENAKGQSALKYAETRTKIRSILNDYQALSFLKSASHS